MLHNRLFEASLKSLGISQLHAVLDDVKLRIGDGVLSDYPEYIEDQRRKADLILEEIKRRRAQ